MNALPKVLRNFNVLLEGTSFAGIATEVTLPKLTIMEDEHRGGGHDAPVMIDRGMEKLELSFTMAEQHAAIFKRFGLRDGQGTSIVFRGAKVDDRTVESYVVEARGRLNLADPGSISSGNNAKNELKAGMSLRYIKISMKGATLVEIDVDNMKRVIDGSDQLAEIRDALG